MEKKTLYRYFGNCATEEERIQVLEWTKASPENLKEFCRERNIYNAILLSTDNIQRTKYDFRRHYRAQLLRIAAVVILLLSVAFGSFYLTMGDRIVPLYSLTVPAGNSNTLLLPDGTKVWLNAGSTIKYPSSFLGMQRNIEIEGEAYLEVAHNRWKPFIVNTPNGKVKVLGTKFYVTSTLKEKDFMVSLIEGSVKISSGEKSAMLKPGYRAQFKDKSFDELMEGFEKCFGVKISIDKDIKSTEHYTGKFYRYNGIQHALQALQHDFNFDFKWDKELNTIQITSKHK